MVDGWSMREEEKFESNFFLNVVIIDNSPLEYDETAGKCATAW